MSSYFLRYTHCLCHLCRTCQNHLPEAASHSTYNLSHRGIAQVRAQRIEANTLNTVQYLLHRNGGRAYYTFISPSDGESKNTWRAFPKQPWWDRRSENSQLPNSSSFSIPSWILAKGGWSGGYDVVRWLIQGHESVKWFSS